jgi:hypothetical protein
MATAEHPSSPVESGWLVDDNHIAAMNRLEIAGHPGVPDTIHLKAQNALGVPVKALLSVDSSNLPGGWSVDLDPAPGDTLLISAGSSTPVQVVLTGYGGPILESFVDISMALNTTSLKECISCDDSTCGGYIGDAGGCSIKLVLEPPVGVSIPEFTASATVDVITLMWRASGEDENLSFDIYRAEKSVGSFLRINDSPIVGSGWLRRTFRDVFWPN